MHVNYESLIFNHGSKVMAKVKVFRHVGQKAKVTSSKVWYKKKGLITINGHVKYDNPTTKDSKVWQMLKFFLEI